MTEKNSKPSDGPLSFLKKKLSSATSSVTAPAGSDREKELGSVAEIAALLIAVLEEKLPVRVFLGNSSFPYYSHFEWELIEDSQGKIIDSKVYLEQGRYLLLAALDPPIGNLKIRTATKISVEFFTKFHLLDCLVRLEQITGTRKLRVSFPEKLRQKQQKRSSFRSPVDKEMKLLASITRPSGVVFKAMFCDLGVGGGAFYPVGATPRIAEHSRVSMHITYPEGEVVVDAIIRGTFAKEGEQVFRAQFLIANHKTAGDVGELASYVQRENMQKRVNTFE